jgi:phosphoribosylformylglycinamidine synthase
MVYRVYVEKKREFAARRKSSWTTRGPFWASRAERVRILNRYDVENIDRELFDYAVKTVFSEPQLDDTYFAMPETAGAVFAVEYLPGQYDQRADSAAQCIQIISRGERPAVRTARGLRALEGKLTRRRRAVKKYVINPVDSREASTGHGKNPGGGIPLPETVAGGLRRHVGRSWRLHRKNGAGHGPGRSACCRAHFRGRGPGAHHHGDPSSTPTGRITAATPPSTPSDDIAFEDRAAQAAYDEYLAARPRPAGKKPVTLMDLGTIGAPVSEKNQGPSHQAGRIRGDQRLHREDKGHGGRQPQDWLLLFKNETHNHPTEIEPFGGAATCIGGAIRDPLSGRAYVYQAMRVTGAATRCGPVGRR